jgi:hypothetical protein
MNNYYNAANNYFNNYGPDAVDPGSYKIGLDKLVCPCCGKKLHLVDSTKKEYEGDDLIKVNESILKENKLADYLLGIIEEEARAIYEDELETNEPETDAMGNIIGEYGERFLYVNKELKKIVKMKANAISNMVKHQGIEVSPFYVENELFQMLKCYGYTGER